MILPAHARWRFYLADGSVHDVFPQPFLCTVCEQPHWWFVNRDGRTCCVQCDILHLQLRFAAEAQPVPLGPPPSGRGAVQ